MQLLFHNVKIVLFTCLLAGCLGVAADESPLELAGDDVVVFLGGTDMVRAQRSGHLETLLTWRFKNELPKFRDLSWEADTVFALGTETDRWRGGGYRGIKGLGNLEAQLARLKATVVIVQLGKNEAFAGGEGIESFIEASDKLFSRLSGDGLELIVISPTPFEKAANDLLPDLRNHNDDLARCVNALSSQAKKHKAHFVDLFTDAEATFTGNGQHVTAGNQARFALHLAAALGTKIVGLFFAHAHPYETAPFSPGHLIFQARISCAPCSYGVHCNNIVCIDKVRPQHLLSAIENHIKTKTWILPERITQDFELNVFETVFDFDMNFKLRPLLRYGLDMDDMFRTAYTLLWRESLEAKKDAGKFEFLINGVCEHLTRDFDCSAIESIDEQLRKKYLILEDITKLSNTGKRMCGNIIRGVSGGNGNPNKIAQFGEDISCIDKKIEVLGLSNPEVRPLADMFSKRKENLVGNGLELKPLNKMKKFI